MIHLSGPSEINEGFQAVWRADFDRAVALLHNADGPGCATMRSRVYMRMSLPKRVVAEFERLPIERLDPREVAEMTLIASSAYLALGDQARSDELWQSAEQFGRVLDEPLFELVRLTVSAVRDFKVGKLEASRSTALLALALADKVKTRESAYDFTFEGNHLRARVLEILSMHAALAGDHVEQERLLMDAVLTSTIVRRHDVFIEVNLLANLASLLATYPGSRARELVLSRANGIVWNDHLDYNRTYIKRGLRCNKDIFGSSAEIESFGGRGYPTLAWRVCDSVDRLLYSNWAERSAFDAELAFTIELAQRVEWQETPGEEISSLTSLAAVIAPHHPDIAEDFMNAHARKMETLSGRYLYVWDGNRPALEKFGAGSIAKARGDYAGALAKYEDSLRYWIASDMPARAAFTGIERYPMSREIRDLEPAASFLRRYPNSAFARRLGRAFERTPNAAPGEFIFLDQGAAS